jgi:hypothetical protein
MPRCVAALRHTTAASDRCLCYVFEQRSAARGEMPRSAIPPGQELSLRLRQVKSGPVEDEARERFGSQAKDPMSVYPSVTFSRLRRSRVVWLGSPIRPNHLEGQTVQADAVANATA